MFSASLQNLIMLLVRSMVSCLRDTGAPSEHALNGFRELERDVLRTDVICEKASIDESYLDVTDAAMARMQQQQQHPWASTGTLPEGIDQIHIGCTVRPTRAYFMPTRYIKILVPSGPHKAVEKCSCCVRRGSPCRE